MKSVNPAKDGTELRSEIRQKSVKIEKFQMRYCKNNNGGMEIRQRMGSVENVLTAPSVPLLRKEGEAYLY